MLNSSLQRLSHWKFSSISPSRAFFAFLEAFRQRHALRSLDNHLLDDLGLTRQDVAKELSKPLWGADTHWKQ